MLSPVLAYYLNFCSFVGMGEVKQQCIHSVYVHRLYQEVIADAAEESMKAAVERVKASLTTLQVKRHEGSDKGVAVLVRFVLGVVGRGSLNILQGYVLSGNICYQWNISLFNKKHQIALVLVQEETRIDFVL